MDYSLLNVQNMGLSLVVMAGHVLHLSQRRTSNVNSKTHSPQLPAVPETPGQGEEVDSIFQVWRGDTLMPGQIRKCSCGLVEISADPWDGRDWQCDCGNVLRYKDAEVTYHEGARCMWRCIV